jgi:hypothetical protein
VGLNSVISILAIMQAFYLAKVFDGARPMIQKFNQMLSGLFGFFFFCILWIGLFSVLLTMAGSNIVKVKEKQAETGSISWYV